MDPVQGIRAYLGYSPRHHNRSVLLGDLSRVRLRYQDSAF